MVWCCFVLSCNVFGGFRSHQWVTNDDSLDTITTRVLEDLDCFLRQHNLEMLRDTLRAMKHKYHIHSTTMESILQNSETAAAAAAQYYSICNCPDDTMRDGLEVGDCSHINDVS